MSATPTTETKPAAPAVEKITVSVDGQVVDVPKTTPDPITGKPFVYIKGADGGIQGVSSASDDAPLKVANFRVRDAIFEGAQKYSEWKFIHTPPPAAVAPGAKPAAGAASGPAGAAPAGTGAPGSGAPNPPGGPMQGARPPASGLEGTNH